MLDRPLHHLPANNQPRQTTPPPATTKRVNTATKALLEPETAKSAASGLSGRPGVSNPRPTGRPGVSRGVGGRGWARRSCGCDSCGFLPPPHGSSANLQAAKQTSRPPRQQPSAHSSRFQEVRLAVSERSPRMSGYSTVCGTKSARQHTEMPASHEGPALDPACLPAAA